jgi:hypothetical protein
MYLRASSYLNAGWLTVLRASLFVYSARYLIRIRTKRRFVVGSVLVQTSTLMVVVIYFVYDLLVNKLFLPVERKVFPAVSYRGRFWWQLQLIRITREVLRVEIKLIEEFGGAQVRSTLASRIPDLSQLVWQEWALTGQPPEEIIR